MKSSLSIRVLACLVGLPLLGAPVLAQDSGAGAWTLTRSANDSFAVDTPCSEEEIVHLRAVPDTAFPNFKFIPQSRVICRTGHYFFVAAEEELPALPPNQKSFLDMIETQVRNDKTAEGSPSAITIDGRRAFINRQETPPRISQGGFVELSKTRVIVLMGASDGKPGSPPMEDQRAAVDRFYASLKVIGK